MNCPHMVIILFQGYLQRHGMLKYSKIGCSSSMIDILDRDRWIWAGVLRYNNGVIFKRQFI